MSKQNLEKSKQLGMSWGAANSLLKKHIIFRLLVQLNENICYRCKKPIEKVDELSIEHKKSWMNVSPDLFWDLDNISFSHAKCNYRAARLEHSMKMKSPPGKSWCRGCKDFLDVSLFNKQRNTIDGLAYNCKSCRSKLREMG